MEPEVGIPYESRFAPLAGLCGVVRLDMAVYCFKDKWVRLRMLAAYVTTVELAAHLLAL